MVICIPCKAEYKVLTIGNKARWHNSHCYSGDRLQCPKCKNMIMLCSSTSHHNDEPLSEMDVQMT